MRGLHQSHDRLDSTVAFSHMEYLLEDLFSLDTFGSPGGPTPRECARELQDGWSSFEISLSFAVFLYHVCL